MVQWTKIGTDLLVGGVAGAADQFLQNQDDKRGIAERASGKIAVDKKLPLLKQYGTYYNYGVPLASVIGVSMGYLRGDWATRAVTIGGVLAGRKVTHQFTTGATSHTPAAGYRKLMPAHQDAYLAAPNPQPVMITPATPVVQPQSIFGGRGDLG